MRFKGKLEKGFRRISAEIMVSQMTIMYEQETKVEQSSAVFSFGDELLLIDHTPNICFSFLEDFKKINKIHTHTR